MKSIRLHLLALALFSSLQGLAQDEKPNYEAHLPKKFFSEFELYAGPAVSSIRGWDLDQDKINLKNKIGYSFGVGISHYLNNRIKINTKLFFERKGGLAEITGLYFDEVSQATKQGELKEDYNFNCYTLSILPYYMVKKLGIGIGPYVSYFNEINLKQTYSFNGSQSTSDLTEYYSQFDFGITATIGYSIPVKENMNLSFQLMQTLGLIDVAKHSDEGWTTKTINTSILIGITFKR